MDTTAYISPASIEVTTAPTTLVVSVSELKTHLRISHSSDDTYLQTVINAAVQFVERYTRRVLPATTFKAYYDSVADLLIPRYPISAITSIQYYDYANVLQTIDSQYYFTDLKDNPARVWFTKEFEVYTDRPAACIVTFTAGQAVNAIDAGLKQVVMMICADMYGQRQTLVHGSASSAPIDYQLLLNAWRKDYFA